MEELCKFDIDISNTKTTAPTEVLFGADVGGWVYIKAQQNLENGLVTMITVLGWTIMSTVLSNNPQSKV